ncbi:hypothetical protein HPP92_011293 [Vanilla planifolia]|uniref:Uncharacterized protein n=1 Tax=Vanilla planifolia TaxID=51239 RepID=A0A835R6C8_VANPL|nr:hypothetical protein HPP92_011596 [Vanilla planifolia]KAG0483209.1 hypothetical protein HPP92_011293 [Vanilla planifolia]
MPSVVTIKTVLSAAASTVLLRTIINDLIPCHFQDHIFYKASSSLAGFSSTFNIIVQQFQGIVPLPNEM